MTEQASSFSEPRAPLRIRLATDADRTRLIPLINSAYSIETFLEGTRTDGARLAAMMDRGSVLVAEPGDGASDLLGCVYVEIRGTRGYLGQLAVDPAHQGAQLGRRIVEAAEDHLRRQGCAAVDITVLSLRTELPPVSAAQIRSRVPLNRYVQEAVSLAPFILKRHVWPHAWLVCTPGSSSIRYTA
jgi:GNAT superfamily N-acetyltransferase